MGRLSWAISMGSNTLLFGSHIVNKRESSFKKTALFYSRELFEMLLEFFRVTLCQSLKISLRKRIQSTGCAAITMMTMLALSGSVTKQLSGPCTLSSCQCFEVQHQSHSENCSPIPTKSRRLWNNIFYFTFTVFM